MENYKASQPAFSAGLSFSVKSALSVGQLPGIHHSNRLFAGETSKQLKYGLGPPDQLSRHMPSTF